MPEPMDATPRFPGSPSPFRIDIRNEQNVENHFSVFQDPGTYVDMPRVYVNSLFSRALPPKAQGGQLTLVATPQYHAGVQDADAIAPRPGTIVTYSTAVQPISLAAPGNTPPTSNASDMLYDPDSGSFGLSIPDNLPSVAAGCFQIVVPSFDSPPKHFNVGAALIVDGQIVLSNFVPARPQTSITCRPLLRFHVVAGRHRAGTTIDFDDLSARSALCDFTGGHRQASIAYLPNGSWDVQMS